MRFLMYYEKTESYRREYLKMSIGQRIKTIRMRQGITIDELAYRLGKNRTTIYRYENGDIENLPLGILDCLADALNTTPAYLLGWIDNNGTNNANENSKYAKEKLKHLELWCEEFQNEEFSDEEYRKIFEYTRFLISIRTK